jgi:hypothetical protein
VFRFGSRFAVRGSRFAVRSTGFWFVVHTARFGVVVHGRENGVNREPITPNAEP